MPTLTTQDIERRQQQNERNALGYRAAAQAKGRPLIEAEMIKVREMLALGRTLEEITAEFTPPLTPREQTNREILDAFSRQIAGLKEDQNAYGAAIRQLQEEVGKLQGEVAELKRAPAKKH